MNKCENCSKNITKKSPGVECGRCEKLVHCSTTCTGLSVKQLTALRASDNLGWTCIECQKLCSRPSLIIPDDEDDEEPSDGGNVTAPIDVKKLLKDISSEVDKCIGKAVAELQESIQYQSDKMDEVLENMEAFKQTIKDLQRKNTELANKNKNLETRVGALEQRLQEIEQDKLAACIEIANVPITDNENPSKLAENAATAINLPIGNILGAKRLSGRMGKPGPVLVRLNDDHTQEKWINTAKKTAIQVINVIPGIPQPLAQETVYIREALTPYNKKLLWTAKQELKNIYRYVWCKRGLVMARKHENDKAFVKIRTLDDIAQITR